MQAARLQLHRFTGGHGNAAGHFAHTHHTVVVDMVVQFHFFSHCRAAAHQYIGLFRLIANIHKHTAHAHARCAKATPHIINGDAACQCPRAAAQQQSTDCPFFHIVSLGVRPPKDWAIFKTSSSRNRATKPSATSPPAG